MIEYEAETLTVRQLRLRSTRLLTMNGFAVTYEKPIDSDSARGVLSAWVTYDHTESENPDYERQQRLSGDYETMKRRFSEMAKDPDHIQTFIESAKP